MGEKWSATIDKNLKFLVCIILDKGAYPQINKEILVFKKTILCYKIDKWQLK